MGTKRKIPIEKRETGAQISVTCSKRRAGLYSKAADLCVLGGARIAILLNPPSSDSTFYSFGHSSADAIIDAFLENRLPEAIDEETESSVSSAYRLAKDGKRARQKQYVERAEKKPKIGFWWEDDFEHCDYDELRCVIDRLHKLRINVVARLNSQSESSSDQVVQFNVDNEMDHFASLGSCDNGADPFLDSFNPDEYFRFEDFGILPEDVGCTQTSSDCHGNEMGKTIKDSGDLGFDSSDLGYDPRNICDNDPVISTDPSFESFYAEDVGISVEDLGYVGTSTESHENKFENFGMLMEDVGLYQSDYLDPWQGVEDIGISVKDLGYVGTSTESHENKVENFGMLMEDVGLYQSDYSDPWQGVELDGLTQFTADFLQSTTMDSVRLWEY